MTAGIVAITVPDSDGDLPDLAAWLRGEDALRGRVQVFDAVVVGVSSNSAGVFCRSLFAWLKRGARSVSLKVKLARLTLLTVACGAGVEARSLGCAIAGVAMATAAMATASRIACMMGPFDGYRPIRGWRDDPSSSIADR